MKVTFEVWMVSSNSSCNNTDKTKLEARQNIVKKTYNRYIPNKFYFKSNILNISNDIYVIFIPWFFELND